MAKAARSSARESEKQLRAARSRAFWSGTLTFGLVSIPVYLFPAYRSTGGSLRMLAPDGTPLSRRYYEPETGKEVESAEIQRGYEVEPGRHVILEDEELEALAPGKSRDIELEKFVDVAELDPLYFERAYFLTPASTSTRPYRLLATTMEETGRAGLATFVMRGKEYLVAILSEGGILRAETLRFADEIRTPEEVGLPPLAPPGEVLVRKMTKAIEKLHRKSLDLDALTDDETQRLQTLAQRKAKSGKNIVEVAAEEGLREEVPDLMNVLRWSLRDSRKSRSSQPANPSPSEPSPTKDAASDFDSLTKEQLYERAKEQEIPGRSSMTKKELIQALEAAS